MDWNQVITRNQPLLLTIVSEMYAMLRTVDVGPGVEGKSGSFTLPRRVLNAILFLLRPAESAVRRLILIAARGIVLKPGASQPFPVSLTFRVKTGITRAPIFQLIDPLKDFGPEAYDNNPDPAPASGFTAPFDPFEAHRLALIGDQPVNATLIYNRLRALRLALNDLPRQARRLARWNAKRDLALKAKGPWRPIRISIFRPGPPPGYRRKDIHQIDSILKDLHYFAVEADNAVNST